MSSLAIIEPKSLLGESVRDAAAAQGESWERIELFTAESEEVGAVSEVVGRAALVQKVTREAVEGFDAVMFCDREPDLELLQSLPASCRVICIDPEVPVPNAVPIVSGINDDDAHSSRRLLSPSPATILLSHLMAPLRDLDDLRLVSHVLLPASARGKAGVDELFAQTRSIISMSDERSQEIFGTQLAFNLLPWTESSATIALDLSTISGLDLDAQILLSQAGVFHCCSAGVFLQAANLPDIEELEDLLLHNPLIERSAAPETLGPVLAATTDKILIGEIQRSPSQGCWLWCCMDNLTFSANNALSIARS